MRGGELAAGDVVDLHPFAIGVLNPDIQTIIHNSQFRILYFPDAHSGSGGLGDATDEPHDIVVAVAGGLLIVGEVSPSGAAIVGEPVAVGGVDAFDSIDDIVLKEVCGDPEVAVGRERDGRVENEVVPGEDHIVATIVLQRLDDRSGSLIATDMDVHLHGVVVHNDIDGSKRIMALQELGRDPHAYAVVGPQVIEADVCYIAAAEREGVAGFLQSTLEDGIEVDIVGQEPIGVAGDAVALVVEDVSVGGGGGEGGRRRCRRQQRCPRWCRR